MLEATLDLVAKSNKIVTPWKPFKDFKLATVTWVYGNDL